MLESMMLVAAGTLAPRTGPRDAAMRIARTCYDHIAGQLGVGIADAMRQEGWVELDDDAGIVTTAGMRFLYSIGIALDAPRTTRTLPLCGICLDWSERRPHFSGRLGKALCRHSLTRGWVRQRAGSRTLDIAPEGVRVFRDVFRVALFRGSDRNTAAA